jgi:6-pyruvoyltetrahydropterin/6-carboxytetrahydropterin synthase
VKLTKTFRFEASHILPKHPGKCSRLHGHSWVLDVSVEGPVNPSTGFVMDYADLSSLVMKRVIDLLDHHHLGQWWADAECYLSIPTSLIFEDSAHAVTGLGRTFYPTSENLLVWIGKRLVDLTWSELTLHETCTSAATLTRKEFDDLGNPSAV